MKLYDIKRESTLILAAKFQMQWSHLGTLFASAWITDEDAAKINLEFPNTIFVR